MLKTSGIGIKNSLIARKKRSQDLNNRLKRFQEWQHVKAKRQKDIAQFIGLFVLHLLFSRRVALASSRDLSISYFLLFSLSL